MKNKKNKSLFFTVVFMLLVLAATPVFAAPMTQEEPTEFTVTAILLWIATGPGVAYLVGLFVSQVLENLSWWHNFPATVKFLLTMVIAFALPIAANLLLQWPGLAMVEPWLNIGIGGIVLWIASQQQYRSLKSKSPSYGAKH